MSQYNFIRVSANTKHEIIEFLHNGKKIKAIKALRNACTPHLGLRIAKYSIDRLCSELKDGNTSAPYHPDAKKIISGPKIIAVTLDYGDGPVTVDLEGMQLNALSELSSLPLAAVADMLDVVDVFKAIEAGERVVIQPQDN